jgi:branched-chain amino acid transport system ATP-binding protein
MAITEDPKLQEREAPTAPMPRVRPEQQSLLRKSLTDARRTLADSMNFGALARTPYGLWPILLIGFAEFMRVFDNFAFDIALPDIVKDLNIKVFSILTLRNLIGFVLIFVVLGLAHTMDRIPRLPFVAGGSILQGFASFFTSRVHAVTTLGASRIMDGVTYESSDIPANSLIADYYPVDVRGKAFAIFVTFIRFAVAVAPITIGFIVTRTSWRVPFLIQGPILIVLGVFMLVKLREPIRGYFERKASGADEELANQVEEHPTFGEAWRVIWGIRTLRMVFIAFIFYGAGDLIFFRLLFFFLREQYHLDAFGRGKITLVRGIVGIVGAIIGGGLIDNLVKRRPNRALTLYGTMITISGLATIPMALAAPLWVVYIAYGVFYGFVLGLTAPAFYVFLSQILPAHIRTLGLTVSVLANIPMLVVAQIVFARLDSWGLRGGLASSIPFNVVGGFILLGAAPYFARDMRNAIASQMASEEYRRTKAEGKLKLLVSREVDVDYDGVQVLFGVDFDIDEGEIIALLGTNGAGKSTLLKAISGVREASGGAIVFDGRDITHMPPHEISKRGIVMMPGGKGIFPGLTVRENLVLGGWLTDDADEARRRLDEVHEIFPILRERADTRAGALSGGEQQQLALAQAFLSRPRLLLIDELSLGLAPAVVQELLEIVRRIHAAGVTLVIVEQSVNVALTIAERAIFMEKGEVKFVGRTRDLLSRPDILRAVYVKGTGALTSAPASGLKSDRELRAGRLEESRVILETQELSKSFGGIQAVSDVSFALREGEILGLIGPNGAGKTTIFDLISGVQIPDTGKVLYDGRDVTNMGPDERARLQLVRRFQDARLFPSLSLYETILVALERRNEVRNMFLTALQLPQVRQSERRVRRRADALIDLLELGSYRDKFVKELSTGLRRITDIACVLAAEPKVLLLDEPSSGIAQAEAESLGPLLRRVRFETGCSVLIIEHDMPLISSISDELIALDQGRVVLRGTPEDVLNDARVIESYLGTSESVIRRSGVLK